MGKPDSYEASSGGAPCVCNMSLPGEANEVFWLTTFEGSEAVDRSEEGPARLRHTIPSRKSCRGCGL